MISRLAWSYVPSEQNNKVFGRSQIVPWPDRRRIVLEVMVRRLGKYAATRRMGICPI